MSFHPLAATGRTKYTPLQGDENEAEQGLLNHAEDGTSSSTPDLTSSSRRRDVDAVGPRWAEFGSANQRRRRLILGGAAALAILLLLGIIHTVNSSLSDDDKITPPYTSLPGPGWSLDELPASFTLETFPRREPLTENVTETAGIQQVALHLTNHGTPTCTSDAWHELRYARLRNSKGAYLMALNLYNSAGITPTLIQELPDVLRFLGPNRVHISILESGSDDETPKLLYLLSKVLDSVGTSYTIISKGKTEKLDKGFNHRIEALSKIRNDVLAPMYDETIRQHMCQTSNHGSDFESAFVMNDVVACANDILEVLYQKEEQGAHQVCSVDWDWSGKVVYDRWVLRAISGQGWYNMTDLLEYWNDKRPWDEKTAPIVLPEDPEDRQRFEDLKPIQVFSCWNGMAVFSASAFLEKGVKFRMAENDHDEHGEHKTPTDLASECFLISVDLWKVGMGKIALASRSRVAYNTDNYQTYRKDYVVGQVQDIEKEREDERIKQWKADPPAEVLFQDVGYWWDHNRWAPWDSQ